MVFRIKIPKFSANIEHVTVTDWYKTEGETVRKGEALAEVTTEKAAVEFESPRSGVLLKILAARKSVVPVGYVIALVGKPGDALPDVTTSNRKLLEKKGSAAQVGKGRPSARAPSRRGRVRATPAARRLAKERGLDLAALSRDLGLQIVRENDVRGYAEEP
jgi:pyruvate dehydrogenase E2 component (dihydrolipoamide acetyltransferase)